MPKTLSVITINYNNLKGLKRTFASVKNQTARNEIEFIVVDGASTDGGKEFLESVRTDIDILVSEKDKGLYDAMNKGLALATGKYVWFVNSGDAIYDANVAEKLIQKTASDIEVIFGDTMFIDGDGNEIGLISRLKPQPLPKQLNAGSFRFGMNLCHQSFLAQKSICPQYNLNYRQAADIDWILQILQKNPKNLNAQMVIAAFETGGSSAQNEKKAWKERYKVLENYYGKVPNIFAHIWIILRRILFAIGIWRPGK